MKTDVFEEVLLGVKVGGGRHWCCRGDWCSRGFEYYLFIGPCLLN